MKKSLLLTACIALLGAWQVVAAPLSQDGWCPVEDNLLPDPEMKHQSSWKQISEMSFEKDPDRPGAFLLKVERTDPKVYQHTNREVALEPGSYHLKVEVRCELDPRNPSVNVMPYIEYADKDWNFVDGGIYPFSHESKWTVLESDFTVPPEAAHVKFGFCLSQGAVGKAWLRRAQITRKVIYSAYLLEPVQPAVMRGGRQLFRFGILDTNKPTAPKVKVELVTGDQKVVDHFTAPVKAGRVEGLLSVPDNHSGALRVSILSPEGKVRNETVIPVASLPKDAVAPANAAILDNRGRLIVDGKKFFPVGLYASNMDERLLKNCPRTLEEDLKVMQNSPFNVILPYDFLLHPRDKANPANDIANAKKDMDLAQKYGMKVVLSVKDFVQRKTWWTDFAGSSDEKSALTAAINAFKNHPALLTYYTFDEDPASTRDMHRERRAFINQLDPWHPTLMVYFKPDPSSEMFGGTADIYGTDPYEIGEKGTQSFDGFVSWTTLTNKFMAEADGRGALWIAPQIFNFGHYRSRAPEFNGHEIYAYPSEADMRTQTVIAVIMGAKGLIYYAFCDLFTGPDKAGEFERRWPEICKVGDLAVELGDFALADTPGQDVPMQVKSGRIMARRFRADDGREAVLVASVGPKDADAELALPKGDWVSKYGLTKVGTQNKWNFSCKGANADVLYKEAPKKQR